MKKLILALLVISTVYLFSSCGPAYVSSEPAYVEINRPPSPGPAYIWIDNGWRYQSHAHTYVRSEGRWVKPKQGRKFESGHWESTPRGHYYVKGRWK